MSDVACFNVFEPTETRSANISPGSIIAGVWNAVMAATARATGALAASDGANAEDENEALGKCPGNARPRFQQPRKKNPLWRFPPFF